MASCLSPFHQNSLPSTRLSREFGSANSLDTTSQHNTQPGLERSHSQYHSRAPGGKVAPATSTTAPHSQLSGALSSININGEAGNVSVAGGAHPVTISCAAGTYQNFLNPRDVTRCVSEVSIPIANEREKSTATKPFKPFCYPDGASTQPRPSLDSPAATTPPDPLQPAKQNVPLRPKEVKVSDKHLKQSKKSVNESNFLFKKLDWFRSSSKSNGSQGATESPETPAPTNPPSPHGNKSFLSAATARTRLNTYSEMRISASVEDDTLRKKAFIHYCIPSVLATIEKLTAHSPTSLLTKSGTISGGDISRPRSPSKFQMPRAPSSPTSPTPISPLPPPTSLKPAGDSPTTQSRTQPLVAECEHFLNEVCTYFPENRCKTREFLSIERMLRDGETCPLISGSNKLIIDFFLRNFRSKSMKMSCFL